jgi:hypothetical protein
MFKKYSLLAIILLAALLLACACTSANDEYETEVPVEETEEPVIEEPDITDIPVIVGDDGTLVCPVLDTWLNDDSESAVSEDIPESDEEVILVTFQIDGDEISSPTEGSNVPDEYVQYQQDTATQEQLWKFITDVIPADQRTMLGEFVVFTDGPANVMGAVDQADTGNQWTIEMDIVDSQDMAAMTTTLVHEFGHMLTLNDGQLDDKAKSCSTYQSSDGCTNSDSYLNAFYDRFWKDIYEEWASTTGGDTGEPDEDQVAAFYEQYTDQFVTDYAATNPEEDIAETWMFFVMGPRPAGDTTAEQKILFFYEYPELVQLRAEMQNGLCEHAQE